MTVRPPEGPAGLTALDDRPPGEQPRWDDSATTVPPRVTSTPSAADAPARSRLRRATLATNDTVAGLVLAPLAAVFAGWSGALRRPGVVVAVIVLLICVPIRFEVGGSVFGLGDLGSAVVLAVAVVVVARTGRRVTTGAAAVFGGLLLTATIATVAAHDPVSSLVGWVRYLQLFVLVPLAVMVAVRTRRDLLLAVHAMIVAAVVEGTVGVWQYVTGTGASYGGAPIRAVGTFGATDVIAMSVVVGFGLILSLGLAIQRTGNARLSYIAVAAALIVPLGLSLSRGSWIATGAAVGVMLLAAGRRVLLATVASVTAVVVVLVGGLGIGSAVVADRLGSIVSSVGTPDSSVDDRYELWATAVNIWTDRPLTGVGIKAFPQYRDSHAPLGLSSGSDVEQAGQGFERQALLSPHNQYLLVLSEQGILGAVAFLVLMVLLCGGAVLTSRRCPSTLRGVGLGIAGLATWQVVQFGYGDVGGASSLVTSVILGLAAWWVFEAPRLAARTGTAGAVVAPGERAPGERAPGERAPKERAPKDGGGFLARAAAVSAVVAAAGSALGLVRDLLVAAFFGATTETDAFLTAWTVPETLAPLLIEGAMAFVMVPAFGRALVAKEEQRRTERLLGYGAGTDPVRELVEGTAPRILAGLCALGLLLGLGAPWVVRVLTPGLGDPDLAVQCMRAVAVTVPLLGIAGYLASALRTHQRFAAPAAIYLAYNTGIIATILVTRSTLGVIGAALGIAIGTALMVLVQLPAARQVLPRLRRFSLSRRTTLFAFSAVVPVAAYTLARQAQTFIERYAGSSLAEGTISHLNYAQKVAQIPITLSFMAAAVTFPIFARSVAAGRSDDARRRMQGDLLVVGTVAMVVTAYLWVYAPQVVATLYERGAFTPEDTAATAAIMRVYVVGLLGQAIVNLLVRPYFTFEGRIWFPAVAMAVGLGATAVVTVIAVAAMGAGAEGIAAGNALGITVTAVMLAVGSGKRLAVAPGQAAYERLVVLALPAAAGGAAGLSVRGVLATLPAPVEAVVGGVVVVGAAGAVVLGFRAVAGAARRRGRRSADRP